MSRTDVHLKPYHPNNTYKNTIEINILKCIYLFSKIAKYDNE